ncbi:hypothetical protein M9Y10_000019 [Tritrichomonas musculus]|uniref:BEACH domain-containing protein n=1 Tax=Tritrichomonas musculus TaxID=1915356 RepID=A0ABR2L363_9EUKA
MKRVNEVLDILENGFKIYQNKHFPIVSITEKFPNFTIIQPFDKNQFQLINQNRNEFTNVLDIFDKKEFPNHFNISELQKLLIIIQNSQISSNELIFFSEFILNQYISFIIRYEKTNSIQNIDILFNSLSTLNNIESQFLINESIRDLICIISNNLTNELFELIFRPISDYYLFQIPKHPPSALENDKITFSLLPSFLKNLFNLEGLEATSNCEKFSSFLSILLMDNTEYFTYQTLENIYDVIKPSLDQMSRSALIIMKDLVNYISREEVLEYFKELPRKFENIVEKDSQPFIKSPIFICEKINKIETQENNEEINNEEINKEEINNEEINKEEINKEEINKEEINKEEINNEEINKEEINKEETNNEETNKEEINKEETNKEEINKEETNKEEINKEETNKEEINKEETNKEEINKEETNKEEINKEETNNEETNNEETNNEEINKEETNNEEINKEEINNEEINKEEINKEEINKEEINKEETNKEEINKEETNNEETNNEETNNEETNNEEINKEETNNEETNKEEINKEETNNEETNNEEINNEETNNEETNNEEINKEETNNEETNKEEINKEETNNEETNNEEINKEETNNEETNNEEINKEETNNEETNKEEINKEETNNEETNNEEINKEETNNEEINKEEETNINESTTKSSVTISPSQSPECLFRFSNASSFPDGLELTQSPTILHPPTPNLRRIFSPSYFSIIDLVSKSLLSPVKSHDEEAQLFADSFSSFIDASKIGGAYEFDYICILIFFWLKHDIRRIHLPRNLLNVRTNLMIEKVQEESQRTAYYSIQYFALVKILQNGDRCFDSILTQYVKYPHFLSEIIEICILQINNLSAMISQHTWIVRTFRLIALQLQTSEFQLLTSERNEDVDLTIEVIEEARLSIFRLFSELFNYNSFLKLFLSDVLFLSFFLSLLFEVNIRKFVLRELEKYLKCDISKENLNRFIFQLTQMINQICPSLSDGKEGLVLLEDIVQMLNSVRNLRLSKLEQVHSLCQSLMTTFDSLDTSDLSRRIFYQIVTLFTLVPNIELDSIEKPLKKFGVLKNDEYHCLLNLLASKFLSDMNADFEIRNGNLMNILFRVFLNHSEVDIIELSTKLCRHLNKNCFTLHKCSYDILILDYVIKHRNDDDENVLKTIPSILENVVLISSVISSPVVVRKFISLFIPIDNRYTSSIHHLLLHPLKMILERAHEIPSSTFSLSQAVSKQIESMKLEKDSFTFTCWIYFEGVHYQKKEKARINILALLNSDMKPFFTFSLDDNVFVIQDHITNFQMPKKTWIFVSIVYSDSRVRLVIEDQNVWEENIVIKVPFGIVTVSIGGITLCPIQSSEKIENENEKLNENNSFIAQICNINIFPLHFPHLPAIIYKLGPRGTQKKYKCLLAFDQSNMTKIAGYSTHAQNRNFADILLRFFKIEILLPFFAQVDLKMVNGKPSNFNITDIVSVFKEALESGEMEQIEFYRKHGFSIISHLLIFSSPEQITFNLYKCFYDIYEILLSEEIKRDMFKNILLNFDIWIVAEHQDHMRILIHWRALIPKYDEFFTDFFPFSRLLEFMRIYYWYSPIEKEKIRGFTTSTQSCEFSERSYMSSFSNRQRNPNLKISDCRSMMFNILYEISQLRFRNDDFSTLMDHCLTIRDERQRIDLLGFMNTIANADFLPFQQITNTMQTLSRVSVLLHSDDKCIVSTVLSVICSVHLHCETHENLALSLDQHLEAVIKYIEPRLMNESILNELLILIKQKMYSIFPICSYVCYIIGEIRLFQEIEPSQFFVIAPNWHLWAVCEALTQNDLHSSFTIFQFLVCCSHREWKNIYDTIEIVGQALKMDELKIDQFKTTFLKVVCLCILNTDTTVKSDVFDALFELIKQHIFFRANDDERYFSRALNSLYKNSPFFTKEEEYLSMQKSDSNYSSGMNMSHLTREDFIKLDLKRHTYKFGFSINENLSWADKDIAQQVLMLVSKFREATKRNIGFAIVIAAFLCHGYPDFVKMQLSEIQLTSDEISTFSQQVDFLYGKLRCLSSSFENENEGENDSEIDFLLGKHMSIAEIMKNTSAILESLEDDNSNIESEVSYVQLHRTFVRYMVESSEKLAAVEGQTSANAESNDESEAASFSGKIESSDDAVESYDGSFEHEEEFENEIDYENGPSLSSTTEEIVEEIRDRVEINSKRWKTLWSNVVMDGAPWDSSLISGKPNIVRWKRDNALCHFFCPFKMKRNRKPNSHIDASFARDAGCSSAASKLLEVHNQKLQEEYLKSAPPILLEIDHPVAKSGGYITSQTANKVSSLKSNKSQSIFPLKSPSSSSGAFKRRKRATKSSSISLISPEKRLSVPAKRRKNKSQIRKMSSFECELLKIRGLKTGKLIFMKDTMHFIEDGEFGGSPIVIHLRDVTHVFMRNRFHLKTAIEVFLMSGKSYFFNFPGNSAAEIVQKVNSSFAQLDSFAVPSSPSEQRLFQMGTSASLAPVVQSEESPKFFKGMKFTEKWAEGKMSNFEYLMKLNVYSERTFNDASQYPFFPWVLSNYAGSKIDLDDPSNYRDLSKPIGAMSEERLSELLQRMNDMSFFAESSFLYSSFAICPLSVYLWFVRIEPFTTLHIMMQSSKFDHPSRLFGSIPTSYKLVTTHLNDYRELPPEFFFMPEFLFNDNEFDLGITRGKRINDVVLPEWVKNGDGEVNGEVKSNDEKSSMMCVNKFCAGAECVYTFRKALESDHVSRHLNEWIDLFWGFKQKGEEARKALNLYNPKMYDTAWNSQTEKDPQKRAEIESTMCHVGQIPIQMFTEPHPKRIVLSKNEDHHESFQKSLQLPFADIKLAFLHADEGSIVLCAYTTQNAKRTVAQIHLNFTKSGQIEDVTFSIVHCSKVEVNNEVAWIGFQPFLGQVITAQKTGKLVHFTLANKSSTNLDPKFLIPELPNISQFASSGEFLAVVSDDATLNLYCLGRPVEHKVEFYGDQITCCALSKSFRVAACGTVSGRIVVCSLFEGKKVCVIPLIHDAGEALPSEFEIAELKPAKVMITNSWGFIVTYAEAYDNLGHQKLLMFLHNINGRLIRCADVGKFPISCWATFNSCKDFDYIVMANLKGMVFVFEAFYLNFGNPIIKCYSHVVAVGYSSDNDAIIAVKEDGNIILSSICI